MKYVIAMDSFKGCLTSNEANEAVAQGILRQHSNAECIGLNMSDGGEGMLQAFTQALGGKLIEVKVHDPLMRRITALMGICGDIAVIETAQACGLTLLDSEERNPLKTTSFGVGELFVLAQQYGCRHCIVGLGGSATNDGGLGMLQALGFEFLDKNGNIIPQGAGGERLKDIQRVSRTPALKDIHCMHVTIASDVSNPLYGPSGAAHVFAPQKGADPHGVELLDEGLRNWAHITQKTEEALTHGAGAAGGLGFAIHAFLGGMAQSGAELLLNVIGFDKQIEGATAVFTGEGRSDRQTLMGKLPFIVMRHALRAGIPTLLTAGMIEDKDLLLKAGFDQVACINPTGCDAKEAMNKDVARRRLSDTAFDLAAKEKICKY